MNLFDTRRLLIKQKLHNSCPWFLLLLLGLLFFKERFSRLRLWCVGTSCLLAFAKSILQRSVDGAVGFVKQLHLHFELLAVAVLVFIVEAADFSLADIDSSAFSHLQE